MKITFIQDSNLSRIIANVGEIENFGVMAFRDNLDSNKELMKEVRKNYGFIMMKCVYRGTTGSAEDKFIFIPEIKKNEMIELGKMQNEFSVISQNNNEIVLIGTNQMKDNSVGKIHRKEETLSDKENLKYNFSVFAQFLSQLLKDSHNDKEIQINHLQVQEKIETSGYYHQEHGAQWKKIIELDFKG